jgi:hypothetical protein
MGGDYAKYPSSYIVCSLLKRYGVTSVLDVTYGEGRFYKLCRSGLKIVASDPVKRDWVVKPDSFIQANVFYLYRLASTKQFTATDLDAVVVDPPKWTRNARYRVHDMLNYLIRTPELIIEYAAKTAGLLGARYLLVHYKKILQLNGYRPVHIVEHRWFHRYLRVDDNNHSFYILYHSTS